MQKTCTFENFVFVFSAFLFLLNHSNTQVFCVLKNFLWIFLWFNHNRNWKELLEHCLDHFPATFRPKPDENPTWTNIFLRIAKSGAFIHLLSKQKPSSIPGCYDCNHYTAKGKEKDSAFSYPKPQLLLTKPQLNVPKPDKKLPK